MKQLRVSPGRGRNGAIGAAPLRRADGESNSFIKAIDEQDTIRYLLELNETENEI